MEFGKNLVQAEIYQYVHNPNKWDIIIIVALSIMCFSIYVFTEYSDHISTT